MLERTKDPMLSALDLARRIEAGTLTPNDVIDLCADAIAARDAEIGAFTALDIEARARARRMQLAASPLRGLPVGMKDIFDTSRFPDRIRLFNLCRPPAEVGRRQVMMVRRAGGVILGKTVTTEFASLQPAKTRNPRNLAHTPGGSSSGSAAAVAAGMLPIAFGSQTGGSVIRPAAYCGVAGYKPSFRLMPTVGMKASPGRSTPSACSPPASRTWPLPPPPSPGAICASTARRPARRSSR